MKVDEELVMALPRKLVEQTLLGLYDPINMHLIKLVGFDFPEETREHFKREIKTWLRKIQRLRIKPNNRTAPAKFYFDMLFEYPFGGSEIPNLRLIMDEITEDYPRIPPAKSPEEIVEWLRSFHQGLAERLHKGEEILDMIPE